MLSTQQAQTLLSSDGNVVDSDGSKVGSIGQIFLDDTTGEPAWVTVKTGWFGSGESFVPLEQATTSGEDLTVPYDKDMIKDAPRVDDSEGHLTPAEEDELYRYYHLDHVTSTTETTAPVMTDQTTGYAEGDDTGTVAAGTTGDREFAGDREPVGQDTSGPNTDSSMTRSEEQLHVGTTTETVGKARLRKFIVTENVTTTVPVSHEEVQVVREPITDANRGSAMAGGDLTEEEHEVELSADRVVVDKETVPVERVRLDKDTVTEQRQVDETVRKEQIETDTGETTVDGGRTADDTLDDQR